MNQPQAATHIYSLWRVSKQLMLLPFFFFCKRGENSEELDNLTQILPGTT